MAEATLAPAAPAAPAAHSKPIPEIHVTEAGMSRGAAVDRGPAPPPPKSGSAQSRLFDDLRKKVDAPVDTKPETKPAAKTATVKKPATSEETEADTTPDTTEAPDTTETTTETAETTTTAPAAEPAKKGKVSPWKLVDEHKAARLKAETELAELRKTMVEPSKVKELETKAEAAERRAKELDDHIKFVDYSRSKEFQDKYQKPYEDAWQRWMTDLSELTVADETGTERPLAPQDLLSLVNMDLKTAREVAEEKFGGFADDVMNARKEIRGLFTSQQKALEEARTMSAKRMEEMKQQAMQQQEAIRSEITKLWTETNQAVLTDEKVKRFFTPIDGDTEGNERLKKGYEIADKAFSVNPNTPGLTPEQRAEVVRLHAAVRNRAAAFGRVAYQNQQLEAKIAELTKQLEQFKSVQPGSGETRKQEGSAGHASARDSILDSLRKIAR